jgi:oligoribonuclease (3'-5' exoribonuclease)
MKHTIFLDLETTGLDPLEPGAAILEIAMVSVAVPSLIEDEYFHGVVANGDSVLDFLGESNSRVFSMHADSGLLVDCRRAEGVLLPPRPHIVEARACAFYDLIARGEKLYMSGANPAFDMSWLRVHMPELAGRFHYRTFDVNAYHVWLEWSGAAPAKSGQAHRALADCRAELAMARRMRDALS